MAILLSTTGKTVETNKATLQRLARDKGDKIEFPSKNEQGIACHGVTLNGKPVGLLFESHEQTIQYLMRRKHGTPRAPAKRNPGVIKKSMTAKEMALTPHNLSADSRFAHLKDGSVYIWDDRFQKWSAWKGATKTNPAKRTSATQSEFNRAVSTLREVGWSALDSREKSILSASDAGILTITKARPAKRNPNGFTPAKVFFRVKYKSDTGPREGIVRADGRAFIWEIMDDKKRLVDSSAQSAAAHGGNYSTKASAIRALKNSVAGDRA